RRSQREWVSARDPTTLWDIYLVNVDGSGERRLVESGFHPNWTADGRGIVFFRENRVLRYDLGTGRETLLLDVGKALPGIEEFGDVELSPDGSRFAFPLRGRFSGVFGLNGGVSGAAGYNPAGPTLTRLTREQACPTTLGPRRPAPALDGDGGERRDPDHDRPSGWERTGCLHGPARRAESRVLPEAFERRALARVGRGRRGPRARPSRLRHLRLAGGDTVERGRPSDPASGQRQLAGPVGPPQPLRALAPARSRRPPR